MRQPVDTERLRTLVANLGLPWHPSPQGNLGGWGVVFDARYETLLNVGFSANPERFKSERAALEMVCEIVNVIPALLEAIEDK